MQATLGSRPAQLVVGHRGPDEVAETGGQFPVRNRPGLVAGRRGFDAEQERGRNQNTSQRGPKRLLVGQPALPQPVIQRTKASLFSLVQWPAVCPAGKGQKCLRLRRVGCFQFFLESQSSLVEPTAPPLEVFQQFLG